MASTNYAKSIFHKLTVVLFAKTSGKVFLFAKGAISFFRGVCVWVFPVIHNCKIFNGVVKFISVLVVNNFFGSKVSSKKLFHNKSVLPNVTEVISKRVVGTLNKSITTSYKSSSVPRRTIRHFGSVFKEALSTITCFIFPFFLDFRLS